MDADDLFLPSLADVLKGLAARRAPELPDALHDLALVRTSATLAVILDDLDKRAFERVASLGPAALKPSQAHNGGWELSPLHGAAVQAINDLFPTSYRFEEMLFEEEEYWEDGRMPIEPEVLIGLPRTWDEWDERLIDEELDGRWSLPVFYFAVNQRWDPGPWAEMAEHFGWPFDMRPKWWKTDDLVGDDALFCEKLKQRGMEEFATAYDCVFAATDNLFIDYDGGLSGEIELPTLSLESVQDLHRQYLQVDDLQFQYDQAVDQVERNPDVLIDLLAVYNSTLKPRRKPRRLLDVLR